MKTHDNKIYYIWLSDAINRSYEVFRELYDAFGSVYDIYMADAQAYSYLSPSVKRHMDRLCDKSIKRAVDLCDHCADNGIEILIYEDMRYPSLLREIEKPPLVLYVRGRIPDFENRLYIAVVGTRKMTEYGKCMAYNLGYSLSKNGAVIVSGMALGNDSAAMCAALDSGNECIGVLGSGVDVAYPTQHARFMQQIAKMGTLISEYPPGTKAEPGHFPERNRIISGLCRATLVIEGDCKSGARITAEEAEKQGRRIFAVPGKVGENTSEITLSLISNGAGVAMNANDILKEYAFLYRGKIDLKTYEVSDSQHIDTMLSLRGIGVSKARASREADEKNASATKIKQSKTSEKESGGERVGIMSAIALKIGLSSKKEDIAVAQATDTEKQRKIEKLSADVRTVYDKLPKNEMFSADDISKYSLSAREFMSAMTMLEIHGLARSYPGSRYTLI